MKLGDPLLHFLLFLRLVKKLITLAFDVLNPSQTADFVFRKEMWETSSDSDAASESSGVESMESGSSTLYNFILNLAVFTPLKELF